MKQEKIRLFRMQKGLSQTELSRLLDIDRTYLSQIENSKKKPSITLLERIAKELGKSLKDFF